MRAPTPCSAIRGRCGSIVNRVANLEWHAILFVHTLQDNYYAENQIVKNLPTLDLPLSLGETALESCLQIGIGRLRGRAAIADKRAFMELEMRRFLLRHGIIDFHPQSTFPGEHADRDAGRGGGGPQGVLRALRRGRLPRQVVRPQKLDEPRILRAVPR